MMEGERMGRFKELDRYQKGILLLLVAMIVVFGVAYSVVSCRVGFLYMDKILQPIEENGNTVYSGTIRGQESSFIVTSEREVTFHHGFRNLCHPTHDEMFQFAIQKGFEGFGIQ